MINARRTFALIRFSWSSIHFLFKIISNKMAVIDTELLASISVHIKTSCFMKHIWTFTPWQDKKHRHYCEQGYQYVKSSELVVFILLLWIIIVDSQIHVGITRHDVTNFLTAEGRRFINEWGFVSFFFFVVYSTTISLSSAKSVGLYDDWWTMHWKGIGRKRPCPNWSIIHAYCLEGEMKTANNLRFSGVST
jgi:hypothetical protein